MDDVAGQTVDTDGAEPLVFGSHLLRPWVIANFVAFTLGFGIGGGVLDSIVRPHFGSHVTAWEAAGIQATGAGLGAMVQASIVAGLASRLRRYRCGCSLATPGPRCTPATNREAVIARWSPGARIASLRTLRSSWL